MIKEIKLVLISDKNKEHNIMHNTISSIKLERENSQTNFIGKKGKNPMIIKNCQYPSKRPFALIEQIINVFQIAQFVSKKII